MADLALPLAPSDPSTLKHQDPSASIAGVHTRAEAEKVAKEFEHMFVSQMLQPMFQGLATDGLTGGGAGEEMYRPMLVDEYAKAISAQSGGFGIGAAVLKEILKLQGLK